MRKLLGIHIELSNHSIYLHKLKIIYSSLEEGKITLSTELIENSIPPVLLSLDYFLYLLIGVSSTVPFPELSGHFFTKPRQNTSVRAMTSILTNLLQKDYAWQGNTLKIDTVV